MQLHNNRTQPKTICVWYLKHEYLSHDDMGCPVGQRIFVAVSCAQMFGDNPCGPPPTSVQVLVCPLGVRRKEAESSPWFDTPASASSWIWSAGYAQAGDYSRFLPDTRHFQVPQHIAWQIYLLIRQKGFMCYTLLATVEITSRAPTW